MKQAEDVYDINTIIQLIEALYSPSTPPSHLSHIQSLLSHFQSSPSASSWALLPTLLSSPSPLHTFFAASTLSFKISLHFSSLPVDQQWSLKENLLGWLGETRDKVVRRKLATAVVGVSLGLGGWEGWVSEVVARVGGGEGMEVLEVVLERVGRVELVGQKRIAYISTLTPSLPHILLSLQSSLSSPPSSSTSTSLHAFTSLLSTGLLSHTTLTPLYPLLLPHLSNPTTTIAACTAVQEILERSSGMAEGGGVGVTRFVGRERVEELVSWAGGDWVRGVVEETVEEGEAADTSLAIFKLLTTIATSLLPFLFSPSSLTLTSPPVQNILHSLLLLTFFPGHSAESIAVCELTTEFWTGFQEEICEKGEGGLGGEWEVVKAVWAKVGEGCWRKGRLGVVGEGMKDEVEAYKAYRSTTIAETILLAYYILRSALLAQLVGMVLEQLSTGDSVDIESTLFLLSSLSSAILPTESSSLPSLFTTPNLTLLSSLPTPTLSLLAAYAPWFTEHPTECLLAVGFVVDALRRRERGAGKALREICDANRGGLGKWVGGFAGVLQGMGGGGGVEDEEFVKVLESVASVVQALDGEEIVGPLLSLTSPLLHSLHSSLPSKEATLQQLSYLTAISKGLTEPLAELLELDDEGETSFEKSDEDPRLGAMRGELGGVVGEVVRGWKEDGEVGQALADFIKYSTNSSLALNPISLLILASEAFQASASPVWLEISAGILVKLKKEDEESIGRPVEVELEIVLRGVSDLNLMDENLDVVQAFLGFCLALLRHFPMVLAGLPKHLDAVITFAERGLGMQERFSLKANIDLLIASIQQTRFASPSSTTFQTTMSSHAYTILTALIQSIGGGVPRSHLTSLSELLHACILRLPQESNLALKELMARQGFPTEKAGKETKEKFLKAVLNARNGKLVRTAVSDFAMVCRGLDGSAYGAASSVIFD